MTNYRTAGAWGSGLGRNLNPVEIDTNFYDHENRIDYLETHPPAAVGISNIAVSGNQVIFHLADGSSFGPFSLPYATISVRSGLWTAATVYYALDLIEINGAGFYLVLQNHTSASIFDSAATSGGLPLYRLVIPSPVHAPTEDYTSTSYTVAAADAGKYKRSLATSAANVIIVVDRFSIGQEVHFRQVGSGQLTFSGGTGVTLNGVTGFYNKSFGVGAVVTIKCVAPNEYDLFGHLAAV